jgi:hypothetical protein
LKEDEEGDDDETTTLVLYDRKEAEYYRRCSPDGFEMASVNVNPEDLIESIGHGNHQEESDFAAFIPSGTASSTNRSYDEGDEDEDLLATTIEDQDDKNLVACLAPRDRLVYSKIS